MPTIMTTLPGIHEITESSDSESRNGRSDKTMTKKQSIEDDIHKLFEAIDLGNSCRHFRGKSAMKRPFSPSHVSGFGISESVSLKQALRGICISQASEMAAVRKRMLRPPTLPGIIQTGDNLLAPNLEPEISSANLPTNLVVKRVDKSSQVKEKVHKGKTVHFKEKVEFSRSSKGSSIGDYSEESYLSGSSSSRSVLYRPHMSGDLRWEAISCAQKLNGSLSFRHFRMLKKIGGGDIGSVYLSELIGTSCRFALKIMDNNFLICRKKMTRAQTEREILEILDHPFLPTLYAHFATDKFSCLVMEYCPGGDLHVLRQTQATRSFSEKAVRFYAAEVLLALEYLHMLGIVYRDLKPENILVREDGHIMLTDFDLSLRCPTVNPTLLKSVVTSPKKNSTPGCIDPFCIQPSWQQLSCLTPTFLSSKTRKPKPELVETPLPQLVVEPTNARSNSFVGTHEYLAPEVVKGEGHGSAVDWWTFGVLLYELLYGGTPFKGSSNEETVSNVVSKCLNFPRGPMVSGDARDLIRRLLRKEPGERMGAEKGAAEIKRHPFFYGMNWALIRCRRPPGLPEVCRTENGMGFEMF